MPERTAKDTKDKSDEGERKSGADVGKIVNLMGIDWFVVYMLGWHLILSCLHSENIQGVIQTMPFIYVCTVSLFFEAI